MALNYRVFEYTNFNSSTFNVALKIHSLTNLWCWCTAHVVDNSVPSVYCLHVDRSSLSTRDRKQVKKKTLGEERNVVSLPPHLLAQHTG